MSERPEFSFVINSRKKQLDYLKELFCYRELFYFFAWRDIIVRYKQAFFGAAWALFRPLLSMLVFTFLFGKIANLSSGNVNYAFFVLAGMLPWQLFSSAIVDTCNSLVNNSPLVSKIYFPRMIIPCAQIVVHLVDFSITAALLIILLLFTGQATVTLLTLPFFILLTLLLCTASGLWLSALTVQYRDFRILVPFFAQFGLFISPVGYGSFIISDKWQWLYCLNPMVGIIDGFRYAFFGQEPLFFGWSLCSSILFTTLLLVSGFCYFRNTERTFADKI